MTPTETEVFEKLKKRLNLAHVEPSTISAATPLFDGGLEFDSIDVLEVSAMMQREYGITLGQSERSGEVFGTLGSLAAFIEKNRQRDAQKAS
jgi:acyl carrier protein